MNRVRRYLPPLLILLPVIFICGKLLLTPVNVQSGYHGIAEIHPERGWPWLYEQAFPPDTFPNLIFPSCQTSNCGFSIWLLLADVAVLSVPVVACTMLVFWWRKRSGGWLRFSVRGLMVIVAVAAIGCGWLAHHARQHRQEQELLKEWDESVSSASEYDGPQWMRRLAPDRILETFHHLVSVDVSIRPSENGQEGHLPEMFVVTAARLPYFRRLVIQNENSLYKDDPAGTLRLGLDELKSLDKLVCLELRYEAADDETLRQIAKLPRLRALKIFKSRISDTGLKALHSCHSLEAIALEGCPQITDEGIEALVAMPTLRTLLIGDCEALTVEAVRRITEESRPTVLSDLYVPDEN